MLDNIPKKISGLGQTAHTRWARLQYKHISSQPSSHTVTGTALTVLWWEEWQVVVMMIRAKGCWFFPPKRSSNKGFSWRNVFGFNWYSCCSWRTCLYGFYCHVEINPQSDSISIAAFAQRALSVAILDPILVALPLMTLIQKNGIIEIKSYQVPCTFITQRQPYIHISLINIIWVWAADTKPRTGPDSIYLDSPPK